MTPKDLKQRCVIDEDGCWLWKGATSPNLQGVRYPRIWAPDWTNKGGEKYTQTGTRAMWHVVTGQPIPKGHRIWAQCLKPTCINPACLTCEKPADRGRKVAESGRWKGKVKRIVANRATGRKRAVLTAEDVAIIRTSGEKLEDLSKRYGVAPQTISKHRAQGRASCHDAVGGMFTQLLRM